MQHPPLQISSDMVLVSYYQMIKHELGLENGHTVHEVGFIFRQFNPTELLEIYTPT